MEPLPKYDKPPVVETVLSIQFAPLPRFTSSHVGLFWSQCLDEHWRSVKEVNYLPFQTEKFGKEHFWATPGLQIGPAPGRTRTQIINKDEDRMIQVQDTRFVYNWRKKGAEYPSYDKLLPEFDELFQKYQQYVSQSSLGTLDPNLWEVTYVNHIFKGDLWETSQDWNSIFPAFTEPFYELENQDLETQQASWQAMLGDKKGRLRVNLRHVRVNAHDGREALDFRLAAQGPVEQKDFAGVKAAFDLGHEAIVRRFTVMTSKKAHDYWMRKA